MVQTLKYGSINTIDTTTIGYYKIKFISEAYTLQEETTCDEKNKLYGELVVKAQYTNCIKNNTKCYWEQ